MSANQIATLSLVISIFTLGFTIYRWVIDWNRQKKQNRLDFIRELFNGFSTHNWKFIDHWDFPGVYPQLVELREAVPPAKPESHQGVFGKRIITLEHLNILLKVFTHRDILTSEDIRGFVTWAHSWYDGCQDALTVILERGDTYPLDFIIWLEDEVFDHNKGFSELMGQTLRERIGEYKSKLRKK